MGKIKCQSCRREVAMICPQCQANLTPVNKNVGTCPRCHFTGVGVCPTCRQQVVYSACFIATAAYGTPMTREIDVLRNFRDSRLERSGVGKGITAMYYRISPPVASIITRNNRMRALTRYCLNPLIDTLKRNGY